MGLGFQSPVDELAEAEREVTRVGGLKRAPGGGVARTMCEGEAAAEAGRLSEGGGASARGSGGGGGRGVWFGGMRREENDTEREEGDERAGEGSTWGESCCRGLACGAWEAKT